MVTIESVAFDLLEESIDNWDEDDEYLSVERAQQISSAVYNKLKCGGWGAAKEELESRGLDAIAEHIEAMYADMLAEEEYRHIEEAKRSKEEALQADADSVKQMELF